MHGQFLTERIEATKTRIVAYEGAIAALTAGTVEEYTLDTGQSVQRVKKIDLASLRNALNNDYALLAQLEERAGVNSGTIYQGPLW